MAAGAAQVLWARCADRNLLHAVSHAQVPPARIAGSRALQGETAGARAECRSHFEPDRGAVAHLQCLLARWRCDGAAGVCELRPPGRLRSARSQRRQREGRHRAGPLWRKLARHQAESRGRTRRCGLHHLLRSGRRRVCGSRSVSRGAGASARGRAARKRDGYAPLSGRSADPGNRRDGGREADSARPGEDDHEDPGAAHLLRRCDAFSEGSRGRDCARALARRIAADLSRGSEQGQSASGRELQLGSQAALRRGRAHSRSQVPPINGLCAAIITMRG